jgi:nucleoside-diphosphate-sugar epimerase
MGINKALGEAFHITSDEVMTWDYIYSSVAKAAGREPKIIHISSDFICKVIPEKTGSLLGDKSASAIFDNSKIKAYVPEFTCEIPFSEGIAETIKWMEASSERMLIRDETNVMMDNLISRYKLAY